MQTEFDERRAIIDQRGNRRGDHPANINQVTAAVSEQESLADQIQRLRVECKWSIEKLAAKTGLDERTVKRHLSGHSVPHLSNLSLYEQAFSKALKKEVVISKMP